MINFALAQGGSSLTDLIQCEGIGGCFQAIYNLGVQVAVALAFLMLLIGGVEYMLSGTVSGKLKGKKRITDAILGLIILFLSGTVLYWINPNIFNAELELPVVEIHIPKEGETAPAPQPTTTPPTSTTSTTTSQGGLKYINRTDEQLERFGSTQLKNLVFCLDEKAKTAGIEIYVTAIVDLATLNGYDCFDINKWSRPPCAHAKYSCHYGGRNCRGQSYAVDLDVVGGPEEYKKLTDFIKQAAPSCGSPTHQDEGSHVHVYAGDAKTRCGCS